MTCVAYVFFLILLANFNPFLVASCHCERNSFHPGTGGGTHLSLGTGQMLSIAKTVLNSASVISVLIISTSSDAQACKL